MFLVCFTPSFPMIVVMRKNLPPSQDMAGVVLVFCGTDTFKEPHEQFVYIEEKVLQIWTPLDYDDPQALGDTYFQEI
ncbi:hypothetical protein DUI87_08364 [Hirundo rustica rustica]|uniref:Uncharacterized protein n=1 Tax=Hirundo rustica rustica TaxID=333673 RepID=A0A3M0KZJ4_HIRRU|nr:hypothetical protein DUI87_08364 [Hirundo rustica rustica]